MTQQKLNNAKESILRIEEEFSDVLMNDYIFSEVQNMIKSNERLSLTPSHFFLYLGRSFVDSLVLGVRRQLDTSRHSISLHKLMLELGQPPLVLTRDYFMQFWTIKSDPWDNRITMEKGEDTFNELVGVGKAHVERKHIHADISILKSKSKLIIDYANHHLAHYSDRPPLPAYPRLDDLSEALESIHTLIRKYYTLLTGTILNKATPIFLDNWKQVFTFPWIDAGSSLV